MGALEQRAPDMTESARVFGGAALVYASLASPLVLVKNPRRFRQTVGPSIKRVFFMS